MRILVADAGATKTDWVKLTLNQDSRREVETFSSLGISPVHHESDFIIEEFRKVRDSLGTEFDKIRFFGTGVGTRQRAEKIENCLASSFTCSDIIADSDMAGAAIAVLGNKPGIACIMGTGSNSCHFSGRYIDRKSASLGFILDDDGGGVAFGKRLLADIFKGIAPQEIIDKFHSRYNLDVPEIVERLYRLPASNRWIASFMPFITENIENPYISQLVNSQISRFIEREFASYSDTELKEEGVGFIGSVADIFSGRIRSKFNEKGWKIRDITAKPLSKLIDNISDRYTF